MTATVHGAAEHPASSEHDALLVGLADEIPNGFGTVGRDWNM
jgi:hypothetical protein